jgi:hypothetical protein
VRLALSRSSRKLASGGPTCHLLSPLAGGAAAMTRLRSTPSSALVTR